jgi:hypothetical protein
MNEQELRNLVREAVERHLVRPEKMGQEFSRPALSGHASHVILKVVPGSEIDEGTCLIEPSVRCNHCGFCQSYGH